MNQLLHVIKIIRTSLLQAKLDVIIILLVMLSEY